MGLFKKERGRFNERKVHESVKIDGKVGFQHGKHRIIQYEGDKIVFKDNMKVSTAMWKITVDDVIGILKELM